MGDVAKTFGLDFPKFISQVIIVLIVYFVLAKYAFGPILAVLEARRKRIADGEDKLKKIESDLVTAEARVQARIEEANRDAERLIAEARDSAETLKNQKTQEAINEAQQITAKAREAAKLEHESALAELKRDFGRLVIESTSKVTGKVLDDGDRKRINEETVGQVAL